MNKEYEKTPYINNWTKMHNIQEKTASILPNLHICSDLLIMVKLCQSPPNPTPCQKKILNLITPPPTPSDERNNLNIGKLE